LIISANTFASVLVEKDAADIALPNDIDGNYDNDIQDTLTTQIPECIFRNRSIHHTSS
jgi:hypothetical protein